MLGVVVISLPYAGLFFPQLTKETYTQPKSSAGDFYGLVHLLFIETIHDI